MNKIILLGASWCPVTKETRELFEEIKKERPNFDYEYIDIDSREGKLLVEKFSVTDVPKTIFEDKIIFHGLPLKEKLVKIVEEKNLTEQQTSKKERKLLQRQQKEKALKKVRQRKKIKKILGAGLIILIIGGGISGLIWYFASRPALPESEIISKNGIHWHPEIKISILGKIQEIPANIGIGITERYIHTHEADGVTHLEFPGLVRKDDLKLGRFFEIWGKKFNKDCIFDKCSGQEGQLKMLVNGKENFEFENYAMKDRDKIEIIFE